MYPWFVKKKDAGIRKGWRWRRKYRYLESNRQTPGRDITPMGKKTELGRRKGKGEESILDWFLVLLTKATVVILLYFSNTSD